MAWDVPIFTVDNEGKIWDALPEIDGSGDAVWGRSIARCLTSIVFGDGVYTERDFLAPVTCPAEAPQEIDELYSPIGITTYDPGPGATDRKSRYRAYVSDYLNHRVVAFDFDGHVVQEIGKGGNYFDGSGNFVKVVNSVAEQLEVGTVINGDQEDYPEGKLLFPEGVAVDSNGNLIVADMYMGRLSVFHPDGTFWFSKKLPPDGKDRTRRAWPAEIATLKNFDSDGNITQWATLDAAALSAGAENVDCSAGNVGPGRIAVSAWAPRFFGDDPDDPNDTEGMNQVLIFDEKMCLVKALGAPSVEGETQSGSFASPAQVAFDRQGRLLVVDVYLPVMVDANGATCDVEATPGTCHPDWAQDTQPGRVQVFDVGFDSQPNPRPILTIGGADGLLFPYGVAVDTRGRIVVADSEQQRLAIYLPDYSGATATAEYQFELTAEGGIAGFPHALTADEYGRYLVLPTSLDHVQVFDMPQLAVFDQATSNQSVIPGQEFQVEWSLTVPANRPDLNLVQPTVACTGWGVIPSATHPNTLQPVPSEATPAPVNIGDTEVYRFSQAFRAALTSGDSSTRITCAFGGMSDDPVHDDDGNPIPGTHVTAPEKTLEINVVCTTPEEQATPENCDTVAPEIQALRPDGSVVPPGGVINRDQPLVLEASDLLQGNHQIRSIFYQFVVGPEAAAQRGVHEVSVPSLFPEDADGLMDPFRVEVNFLTNGLNTVKFWAEDGLGNLSLVGSSTTLTVTVNEPPVAANDTVTLPQETATAIYVGANDTDVEDGSPTVTGVVTPPAHGSLTGPVDGAFTYTSVDGYQGADTFTYRVTDSSGATATATVTITVAHRNHAPVPVADSATTDEGTAVFVDVLANDADPDGDTLRVLSATTPAHGTTLPIETANGWRVRYIPAANFTGSDTFSYTVVDPDASSATATVAVTVVGVQDPPTAVDDSVTTNEDTPVTVDVLANDFDVDGDTVSLEWWSGTGFGTVTRNGSSLTFTPSANFTGNTVIAYRITDGARTASATVFFTVLPVNDPPAANNSSETTPEDTAFSGVVTASDVDGDAMTFASLTSPQHGALSFNADGTYTYAPAANYTGGDSFTFSVSDPGGLTANGTVSITVTPVNDRPVADNGTKTTAEDTPTTGTVTGSDVDGDTLTFALATSAAHGTVLVGADGSYTYAPALNYNGPDSFTFTVNDGDGLTDTGTVVITVTPVNDPPTTSDQAKTTAEDTPISGVLTAVDPEADNLAFAVADLPQHGSVLVNANGTYTYTPAANYTGADAFTFTVSDNKGGSAAGTVTLTVTPVNDPPVASDTEKTTPEDTPFTGALSATDADGDALTFTPGSNPTHGTLVFGTGGSYTYTPALNYSGPDSFTFTVTDGMTTITGTVMITVTPVNDPPVAQDDSATTLEDTPVTVDVLANDSDLDGDTLSIASTTAGAHGTTTIVAGKAVYTPAANFNGTDTFSYTLSDGHGGSATASVAITVTPQNDAPVADNGANQTPEDTAVVGMATATDPDGDELVFSANTGAGHGTVLVGNNGSYTYTPAPNFTGIDSFTFAVSDEHGGRTIGTVIVTVTPVNDPPQAVNDSVETTEDTPVRIDVRGNDTDLDGDPLTVASFTQGAHGTVTLSADGALLFTPAADYNGSDTFSYTISDGQGGTASATVTVTVTAANDAPDAMDDTATTQEDAPLTLNVTANDTDPENDALTVTAVTQPAAGGTVAISGGSVVFTPTPDFSGSVTFSYTVSDGHGGTSTAMVTVTVTASNDSPVAVDDEATTSRNHPVVVGLLMNDTDPEGDTLTVTSNTQPLHGTVVIANGVASYQPAAGYSGSDQFTYTISDGHEGTATATVRITIRPNNAPVCSAATANPSSLWPPNHKKVDNIVIGGVTDEDGTTPTIKVTYIWQDEPTDSTGDGSSNIDGGGVGTANFWVRRERSGNGDGRVYEIGFEATDGTDTCTGKVFVGVPHDQGGGSTAIDSVWRYDSTVAGGPSLNGGPGGPVDPGDNHAPVVAPVANRSENRGTAVSFQATATDEDEDAVTFSATGLPPGISISPAGLISGSLTTQGVYTVTITAKDVDNMTGSVTFTWTVIVPNQAPIIPALPSVEYNEGADISGVIPASDPDGDDLTFSATNLPPGVTLNPSTGAVSGTFSYTSAGTYSGVVTVTDSHGASASTAYTVIVRNVNRAPIAVADSYSTSAGAALQIAAPGVLGNDSDADGGTLTVSILSQPANGTLSLNANGAFTYTPTASFSGTVSFVYQVQDTDNATDTATVTITVIGPPVAVADSYVATYNTPLNIQTPGVLANDTNPAGTAMTATLVTQPAHGTVVMQTQGAFAYTPANGYAGADSFAYRVSAGAAVGNTVTVTLRVNRAPVAVNDGYTVVRNKTLTIAAPGVASNDSDPDGNPLSVQTAYAASNGSVTLNSNGSFTFTPTTNFTGTASFRYKVKDDVGLESNEALVQITVTPNHAPTVTAVANRTDTRGTAVSLQVAATDSDGDTLTFSATGLPPGLAITSAGLISGTPTTANTYTVTVTAKDPDNASGSTTFSWTIKVPNQPPVLVSAPTQYADEGDSFTVPIPATDPEGDSMTFAATGLPAGLTLNATTGIVSGTLTYASAGTYSVVVTVTDSQGASASETYVLTVNNVNRAPVAVGDSYSTNKGVALQIAAPGVTANDTDADGGALTASIVSGPSSGSVTLNANGSFTYTPTSSFAGTVSFVYRVRDTDNTYSNQATVTITVIGPPVAVADSYVVTYNTPLNVQTPGVLANDSNPSGTAMTATVVTQPAHGSVVLQTQGAFAYTPANGYAGTDSFTYRVSAGSTVGNTVTVSLRVNRAPVAGNDSYSVNRNQTLTIAAPGVLGDDSDPDGDSITAQSAYAASNGSVTLNSNGSFTFTPATNFTGTASFRYKVRDEDGLESNEALVQVTVTANQAPTIHVSDKTTKRNTTVSYQFDGDDEDDDDDDLTYTVSGLPAGLHMSSSGKVTGKPTTKKKYTVTITVKDPSNATDSDTFYWTIN